MKVILNFGGFYGSQHEQCCENMLDNYFDVENGGEYPNKDIDYKLIYKTYSQVLCEEFGEYLGVKLEFSGLISPAYYNYTTDKIEVEVSDMDALKIIEQVRLEDLEALALKWSTSRDGYIPFYTYEELLYNLEYRVEFALDLLWEEFEQEFMGRMYESDFIYNLDFID